MNLLFNLFCLIFSHGNYHFTANSSFRLVEYTVVNDRIIAPYGITNYNLQTNWSIAYTWSKKEWTRYNIRNERHLYNTSIVTQKIIDDSILELN